MCNANDNMISKVQELMDLRKMAKSLTKRLFPEGWTPRR